MDYILGNVTPRVKVLEEFQKHNDEMTALLGKGYAKGTLDRFTITINHLRSFIRFKFNADDIEFTDLNLEFIKDFEFYLRTVRNCSNNTTLKYIANFKKIVIRAIDKEVILKDPFKNFKSRKTKILKKPLSTQELYELERHYFTTERLNVVRDVFVFQCYTGLAYIDAYQLKKKDIKDGIDGNSWIMSERQKTGSPTNGNGFTIYDRGRGSVLSDKIKTTRNNINDNEVTFENAWGICDDDIYNKMLKVADEHYKKNELFFNFVMTTSNHRPYTYPDNAIDILLGRVVMVR
ncbi:phage integrase SAM-like domain-containing protein [Flavobacterium sp. XS2P39]|uniref:site-specific integrase n=1 Tax=Flavobacterium sp. XS2P39 TaxID=3401725 RepID=UPI003AAD8831